eukprot:7929821-Pyramimonas_sp.AAC.1
MAARAADTVPQRVDQLQVHQCLLKRTVPGTIGMSTELSSIATSRTPTTALVPDTACCASMVKIMYDGRQRMNLGTVMDRDWKKKHEPILHDDCEPLPPPPPRRGKPECHEVG